MSVYITNTGSFLPNEAVENDRIESVLGMVGGRPSRVRRLVLRNNGIKQRYYAIDPETGELNFTNAQMTAAAIRKLFATEEELAGIQCLATGTSIPDQIMPNHGVMVHGELGNGNCEVVSTSGICLSGMSALKYAYLGVKSGEHRLAVASGSELLSPMLLARHFEAESTAQVERLKKHPELAFEKDFLRWMLSDGAGAFLLEPSPRPRGGQPVFKVEWIEIHSFADELETCMYAGAEKDQDGSLKGWRQFEQQALLDRSVMAIKQDVKLLNANIVPVTLTRTLSKVIDKTGISPGDITYFLPHISSMFFAEKVQQALTKLDFAIPQTRWFTNLAHIGNTGAASIYIMLDELAKSGRLERGDRLLCFVPESGRFSSSFMLLTVQ
jgi:3-oxoacyl-[acyl-carrier-protein] synthase III